VKRIGILLIVHPCREKENNDIKLLVDDIESTLSSLYEDKCDIYVLSSLEKNDIENTLRMLLNKYDKVIVLPLLVREGSHFQDIENIVKKIKEEHDGRVLLLPTLTRIDSVRSALVSEIVNVIGVPQKFLRIFEETGDLLLISELRMNCPYSEAARAVKRSKILTTDDVRILTFVDVGKIFPGLKVLFEEDYTNFSYPPQSIVVICRRTQALKSVLKNIEKGITPSLIIAVSPALSREEVELKRSVLKLNIPTIVTVGSRGGPHVAGMIISSLIGEVNERG